MVLNVSKAGIHLLLSPVIMCWISQSLLSQETPLLSSPATADIFETYLFSASVGFGYAGFNLTDMNTAMAFLEKIRHDGVEREEVSTHSLWRLSLNTRITSAFSAQADFITGPKAETRIPSSGTQPQEILSSSMSACIFGTRFQHRSGEFLIYGRAGLGPVWAALQRRGTFVPVKGVPFETSGSALGYTLSGGASILVGRQMSFDLELSFRYAHIGELLDENGSKTMYKYEEDGPSAVFGINEWGDGSLHPGYKMLALDYSGIQITCSVHFFL